MAENEADLNLIIGVVNNAKGELEKISNNFKKTGSELNKEGKNIKFGKFIEDSVELSKKSLATLTTSISALGTISFKSAYDYKSAFSIIEDITNITEEEISGLKNTLENVFTAGFYSDLEEAAKAIAGIRREFGALNDKELADLSKGIGAISQTFEQDIDRVTRSVGVMTKSFDGLSNTDALDVLTTGLKSAGDASDDLIDSFLEYGPNFAALGLSAQEALTILNEGARAGVRNYDDMSDALREFSIRVVDGSDKTRDALTALGLDYNKIENDFATGGERAREAFGTVINTLNSVDDSLLKTQLGVDLIGTKFEDSSGKVLPAMASVKGSILDVQGATEALVDATENSLGSQMSQVWRNFGRIAADVGEGALPLVSNAFKKLNDFLDDFKIEDVTKWLKENEAVIYGVSAAITASLIPVLLKAVRSLIITIKAATPLTLVLGAIGVAVFAMKKAWDENLFGIQEKVQAFVEWFKPKWETISFIFTEVVKSFKVGLGVLADGFKKTFEFIGKIPEIVLNKIIGYINDFVGYVIDKINGLISIANDLGASFDLINKSAYALSEVDFGGPEKRFKALVDGVKGKFKEIKKAGKDAFENSDTVKIFRDKALPVLNDVKEKYAEATKSDGAGLSFGGIDLSGLDMPDISSMIDVSSIKNDLGGLSNDFSGVASAAKDMGGSVNKSMVETTESVIDAVENQKEKITELNDQLYAATEEMRESLQNLKQEYDKTMQGLDDSLGSAVVEQEDKIKSLKEELQGLSEKGDGDRAAEVEDELKREEDALKNFLSSAEGLEDEIGEARRRASLTNFERMVEDLEARRLAEEEAFEKKKADIEKRSAEEVQLLEEKLNEETERLNEYAGVSEEIDALINEARVESRTADFESAVEFSEGKQKQITKEYAHKKTEIDKDILTQMQALAKEKSIFSQKRAEYAKTLAAFQSMKDGINIAMEAILDIINKMTTKTVERVDFLKTRLETLKKLLFSIAALSGREPRTGDKEASTIVSAGFRAAGGEVEAGRSYIVGELGQERFVPKTDGIIYPNSTLAQQNRNTSQNFNITMSLNIQNATIDNESRLLQLADSISENVKSSLTRELQLRRMASL